MIRIVRFDLFVCFAVSGLQHVESRRVMSVADGKNVLSLCDIYHIATDLRQEFERLMASYGPEKFSQLVRPVVRSLELLEYLMEARQQDDEQLQQLKNYVDLLQAEKHSSAMLKEKYEKVKVVDFLLLTKMY